MRLNPISVGVGRISHEDMILSGYEVPKGTVLVSQNQVSCRLPEYFENPNQFLPERWDRSKKNNQHHPFLLLPFGFGPRMCIGRRLAESSILQLVLKLTQIYPKIDLVDKSLDLDCKTLLINKPDQPLNLKLTRNNK